MNLSNESIRWLAEEHMERRLQEASTERLARAIRATTRRRRAPRIARRLPLFGLYSSRIDPVGPQS
jgi:hypothetical protein